ncbi:hypothetical protein ACET3Z_017228 [Daucus carota]
MNSRSLLLSPVLMTSSSNHSASDSQYSENVEKSLCNLNSHLELISEKMVEVTRLSASLNKMAELLGEDMKGVRKVQAELVQRLRHEGCGGFLSF